jgi:hypothetical protein
MAQANAVKPGNRATGSDAGNFSRPLGKGLTMTRPGFRPVLNSR